MREGASATRLLSRVPTPRFRGASLESGSAGAQAPRGCCCLQRRTPPQLEFPNNHNCGDHRAYTKTSVYHPQPSRWQPPAKIHSSLPRERQTQAPSCSFTRLCSSQYQIAYHDTHYDSSKGQSLELFSAPKMVKKSLWRWRSKPS
jgi:hypothetical protein